ncbi:MAG: hypothetical protein CMF48_02565 [Legionellales bacterium]|nr:hypothetical protein [Legionellales bacterium]
MQPEQSAHEDEAELILALREAMNTEAAPPEGYARVSHAASRQLDRKAEEDIRRKANEMTETFLQRVGRGVREYEYVHNGLSMALGLGTDMLVPPLVAKPAKIAMGFLRESEKSKRLRILEDKLVAAEKRSSLLMEEVRRLRLALAAAKVENQQLRSREHQNADRALIYAHDAALHHLFDDDKEPAVPLEIQRRKTKRK